MPLDSTKLRAIEFGLSVAFERLERMERGTSRADDAGWAEHKHPRASDGKFTSGAGAGKTKSIAKDYISKLANAGKTIPVQGFIKHLIKSGVPVKNIIEATKEEFGEAVPLSQIHSIFNKKMLPSEPTLQLNHDHWDEPYHGASPAEENPLEPFIPHPPTVGGSQSLSDCAHIFNAATGQLNVQADGWGSVQGFVEAHAKMKDPVIKAYAEQVLKTLKAHDSQTLPAEESSPQPSTGKAPKGKDSTQPFIPHPPTVGDQQTIKYCQNCFAAATGQYNVQAAGWGGIEEYLKAHAQMKDPILRPYAQQLLKNLKANNAETLPPEGAEGQPEPVSKGEAPVEPEPVPTPAAIAKKGELSSVTKGLYQQHIGDWQDSMGHDSALQSKFDEIIDAVGEQDPAKKEKLIAALTPLSSSHSSHADTINEFMSNLQHDHGIEPSSEMMSYLENDQDKDLEDNPVEEPESIDIFGEEPSVEQSTSNLPKPPTNLLSSGKDHADNAYNAATDLSLSKDEKLTQLKKMENTLPDVQPYIKSLIDHLDGTTSATNIPQPPEVPEAFKASNLINHCYGVAAGTKKLPDGYASKAEYLEELADDYKGEPDKQAYLTKLADHVKENDGLAQRVLPEKPAAKTSSLPDIYEGASEDDKDGAKTLKEIAEGKHSGGNLEAAKKTLQTAFTHLPPGHVKDYAGQLIDHLSDNPQPAAASDVPEPPSSIHSSSQTYDAHKIVTGQKPLPPGHKDVESYLHDLHDDYTPGGAAQEYMQKLIDHVEKSKSPLETPQFQLLNKTVASNSPGLYENVNNIANSTTLDHTTKVAALANMKSIASGLDNSQFIQSHIDALKHKPPAAASSTTQPAAAQPAAAQPNGGVPEPTPAPGSGEDATSANWATKKLHEIASGKSLNSLGIGTQLNWSTLDQLKQQKAYYDKHGVTHASAYAQQLIDGIEDGTITMPQYQAYSGKQKPTGLGKKTQKMFDQAQATYNNPHLSPDEKMAQIGKIKAEIPMKAKWFLDNMTQVLNANKNNATYVPPNAGPVGMGHKMSPDNHTELASLQQHWEKVGPSLKPTLDEKHEELKSALSQPTAGAQKMAIASLKPIENASGQGQKSMNAFISKVQNDYGVAPQPEPVALASNVTPSQQAAAQSGVAAAIKKAPHKNINHLNEYEDSHGNSVVAKQVSSTKNILGDHYNKVTAAYGNSEDGTTDAVSQAMSDYWKDIDKTWNNSQKNAIYSYQNGGYDGINKHLLSGGKSDEHDGQGVKASKQIGLLKEALKNSHVPADTPVYRGLKCDISKLTGFSNPADSVGRCFEHRCFASTSRSRQTSLGFGSNTLMKMTIPAGTPGLVVGGQITGDGGKHYEKEIILGPRSMWRIDKYEANKLGANHLIHCTYLGERTDEMMDLTGEGIEDN
jgi:hypothetical protein